MHNTPTDEMTRQQWAVFDQAGQLACLPIVRHNPRSITVVGGAKAPHQRVWMICEDDCAPLLPAARMRAGGLDIETIWCAAAGDTLSAAELAQRTAAKDQTEVLAVLQAALDNPAYFRRSEGRLTPAPESALKKARAALQRRAADIKTEQTILADLSANRLPPVLVEQRVAVLAAENKNTAVYRAAKKAAGGERYITEWLVKIGVFADIRECWETLFAHQWQPQSQTPPQGDDAELPSATARAFSIDEVGTFEVDDAFSVTPQDDGVVIGIHIAAPALDGGLFGAQEYQHQRLISVYFPTQKHPMLSAAHIDKYSLSAGDYRPALSLYCHFNPTTGDIGEARTKLERVFITDNYSPEDFTAAAPPQIKNDYRILCDFAERLNPSPDRERMDYRIIAAPPQVIVAVRPPISYTIESLMRHVNGVWGRRLAQKGAGGLFRSGGATTTNPESDNAYAWTSSPLRRAADLFNQRLLLSLLDYAPPPKIHWRTLGRAFSAAQTQARRHQDIMERHWILCALHALPTNTVFYGEPQKKGKIRLRDYPLSGKIVDAPQPPPTEDEIQVRLHEVNFFTQQARFILA